MTARKHTARAAEAAGTTEAAGIPVAKELYSRIGEYAETHGQSIEGITTRALIDFLDRKANPEARLSPADVYRKVLDQWGKTVCDCLKDVAAKDYTEEDKRLRLMLNVQSFLSSNEVDPFAVQELFSSIAPGVAERIDGELYMLGVMWDACKALKDSAATGAARGSVVPIP